MKAICFPLRETPRDIHGEGTSSELMEILILDRINFQNTEIKIIDTEARHSTEARHPNGTHGYFQHFSDSTKPRICMSVLFDGDDKGGGQANNSNTIIDLHPDTEIEWVIHIPEEPISR